MLYNVLIYSSVSIWDKKIFKKYTGNSSDYNNEEKETIFDFDDIDQMGCVRHIDLKEDDTWRIPEQVSDDRS